jgi:hypothetical protein
MRSDILLAGVALATVAATGRLDGQKLSLAEVAAQLSGTWSINRTLSPAFAAPAKGGGGRSRGAAYAIGGFTPQRGGRGSAGSTDPTPSTSADLTPAELAERTAMRQIEQIAPTITIKASPDIVSFLDQRGELSCATDDKPASRELFGARVSVRCRWDKQQLRQEFSVTRSKLVRAWGVDGSGHLVLRARIEGISQTTPEAVAVFDRSS